MNFGRLWGLVFASMTIGFIADTYFVIKGMRTKRMGLLDVLLSLILPFFILLMLTDEHLIMGQKIIDSIIAFLCVVSGTMHIYVLRMKMPQDKKEQ